MTNLKALLDQVHQELDSLESVNKTIKDHNEYLKSQLDTYRAYLHNVRSQAGTTAHRSVASNKVTAKKK